MNFIKGFDLNQNTLPETPAWTLFRKQAYTEFLQLGLPTRKLEDWKYLNLQPLADLTFKNPLPGRKQHSQQIPGELQAELALDFYHLVFVNGILEHTLSDIEEMQNELAILPLSDVVNGQSAVAEGLIHEFKSLTDKLNIKNDGAFEQLNNAFFGQGILIKVKGGAKVRKPIRLIHWAASAEMSPVAIQTKFFVKLEENAQAVLMESFFGEPENTYFVNQQTEIILGKKSKLEYVRQQSESPSAFHIGRTQVYLSEACEFNGFSYQDGARLARHNFHIYLHERMSDCQMNGVYLTNDTQVLDNHTLIHHVAGECQSRQTYKGILNHQSRAIFNGKVLIGQGSSKASSEQLNKNLILSSQAEVDSKPELQIYNDDVKATHGSTIGQLNEDEIFYFESRGINRAKAIELISFGFINELLQLVQNRQIVNLLESNFRKKLAALNV